MPTTGSILIYSHFVQTVLTSRLRFVDNSVAVLLTPSKFVNPSPELQIRIVAGYREVAETREFLVAGACNHPNLLVLPFTFELIRTAA